MAFRLKPTFENQRLTKDHGVMVFTKAKKGVMAEATVGGQKFEFEPLTP